MLTRDDTVIRVSILLVLSLSTPVLAQSSRQGTRWTASLSSQSVGADLPPLTLEAALTEAIAGNPDLVALRRTADVSIHRPTQEQGLPAPRLEGQIWQWPIDTLNPANTNMYMLTMSQDLPGRGKRALRTALADKDVDIAQNNVAIRSREVQNEVKQVYAELGLTRKAIEIHESNSDLLRQFADMSTAKYETGHISLQDVLKSVVELSTLHEDLVALNERSALAEARLNTLLNRPPEAPIGRLDEPRSIELLVSSAELQELAVGHEPALRAAALERERAEAARAVAKREYKPDFFVAGGYMILPHGRDAVTGTVGLTWPSSPWSRKKLDAAVAEADAEVEAAQARERALESRVRLDVQSAYVRLASAQRRASLLEDTVIPQSQQALEISRGAYQADRGDVLALIDGRRTLLDAQMGYFEAVRDAAQAASDLERVVGVDGIASGARASLVPAIARRMP